MSGLTIEHDSMDVPVKFGDSRSNRSRDIRTADFVMDYHNHRLSSTFHATHRFVLANFRFNKGVPLLSNN